MALSSYETTTTEREREGERRSSVGQWARLLSRSVLLLRRLMGHRRAGCARASHAARPRRLPPSPT